MFNSSFPKPCRLRDKVEKYAGARGATNDVTIWRIRITCWISKDTCKHAHAYVHALGKMHARVCAHTHNHGNSDSRTRLSVSLYVHCLSCLSSDERVTYVHIYVREKVFVTGIKHKSRIQKKS